MADFDSAFDRTIQNEGGYRLVNIPADKGGQTYAGIARNYHPNGPGGRYIDAGDMQNLKLPALVRGFYRDEFWEKISGDGIASQMIAEAVFDFAVNAGVGVGCKACTDRHRRYSGR